MDTRFTGSITALITPFRDGAVDEAALRRLVEFQIQNGTDALVPCGTTGESPTLTPEEHERVIALTVQAARDYAERTGTPRVAVIAGTGSNSTAEAIHYSQAAERDGADALLHVTPYYNKPTQEGLYRHFAAIAAATSLPIILYNVPSRTGGNLLPETVARLAQIPTIAGIKEASGSLDQASEVVSRCGPDFIVLSGDDSLTLPILSVGGHGVISVVANIAPAEVAAMVDAWRAGRVAEAQALHLRLFPVARAMFVETNPGPVKAAAAMLGLCTGDIRLPLAPVSDATRARIETALAEAGIRAGAPV
ncbi:MAG: 4-hydroxy-tetrahydrodipicolinate synthase [Thermomicrobiales bacterium]